MKRKKQNTKGITLIALVVTIVVLLILAAIAINLTVGNNGLLSRAKDAKSKYDDSYYKEMIELAVASLKIDDKNEDITRDSLKKELDNNLGEGKYDLSIGKSPYVIIPNNSSTRYIVTSNGNVIEKALSKKLKWFKVSKDEFSNSEVTVKIGDYIKYNPIEEPNENMETTYTSSSENTGYTTDQIFSLTGDNVSYDTNKYGWQVIGITDDNKLMIVSEDLIKPINSSYYNLAKIENAVTELNNICSLYGKGYGAVEGRSITVEDIDKITGYNPKNVGVYDPDRTGTGKVYGEGTIYEYGNILSYYWDGSNHPYYTTSNGLSGNYTADHSSGFWSFINGKININRMSSTASIENKEHFADIKIDYYFYYPETLTDNNTDTIVDGAILKNSNEYNMIFLDDNNIKSAYFLASTCTYPEGWKMDNACYGIRNVAFGRISRDDLLYSKSKTVCIGRGIRAVVILEDDIELLENENGEFEIIK